MGEMFLDQSTAVQPMQESDKSQSKHVTPAGELEPHSSVFVPSMDDPGMEVPVGELLSDPSF